MTTFDLVEAVRLLVIEVGAINGYVSEDHKIDPVRENGWTYWHVQVWFRRPDPTVAEDRGESVALSEYDSPEKALLLIREMCAARNQATELASVARSGR